MLKLPVFLLSLSILWTPCAAQQPADGLAGGSGPVTRSAADGSAEAVSADSAASAASVASAADSAAFSAAAGNAGFSDTTAGSPNSPGSADSAAGSVPFAEPDPAAPNAAAVPMSLNDCMAYAVEHSPQVRRQDYTNRNYRQDYIESIAALVPSVSGQVNASTNFGRAVDPETNTYAGDISSLDNSYGISGQMPIFEGLSGINTVRAARVMRMMGVEELQQVRDEAALKTMEAYFDVVYYTESVQLAREQLETSTANLVKSRKQLELGLKSAADVAEVESQRASDDYLLTQQENNLALARIALAEAMNYPADRELRIDTHVRIETPAGAAPFGEVLGYALDHHPKAQGAAYDVRQQRLRYSAARGRLYPSLYVGGGYSTGFSMYLEGEDASASFTSQFRDKRSYYFQAQLSIPIFGGLARRTAVNRARNNWHIAEQQRQQTLRTLQSEVAQAYQQMLGFGKEYVQATKKADAASLAYAAVEGKYDRGMVSALELQTAANNLLKARSERLRARLQYIVKTRLVEYFNGEPLIR